MTETLATDALRRLVGTWTGTGQGRFPTIDPFRFAETLRFAIREGGPELFYEQRTSLLSEGEDDGDPSHWESGFLIVQEDGSIDLLNAQASGRTEVLTGRLSNLGEAGFELELTSTSHANDARMVATTRTYRLDGDSLSYEIQMATDRVPERQHHIATTLVRSAAT